MSATEQLTRDSRVWLEQLEREVTITAATYTVRDGDDIILCDTTSTAITVTLPRALNGRRLTLLRIAGANNVTVSPAGANTINGGTSATISASWTPLRIKANVARTGWYSA